MKSISITFVLILFTSSQNIFCQSKQFFFDNYTTEDGLPDNYINSVFQDQKGWIWAATGRGIERFDGIKFKNYPIFFGDSLEREDILVRNFYETKSGDLYACTEESGLVKYNANYDRYERIIFNGELVLANVSVKDLVEDHEGNLWAATKKGVCKIDLARQKVLTYNSQNNSLSSDYVRKVLCDKNHNLWIGTRSGLDQLNPKTGKIINYSKLSPLLNDDIKELYFDNRGLLWIGTTIHNIVLLDINNNLISNFIPDKDNDRSVQVNSIIQDAENRYWIGTRGGLYICNESKKVVNWLTNDAYNQNSIIHNSVLDISMDEKGDIWLSTRGGLSYMAKEKQIFETYKPFPDNNKYLNSGDIYCIWQRTPNEIWLGTESGGINILNRNTGTFRYITEEDGLGNNCVKAIRQLNNGKILIGTFQGGLDLYDPVTKRFTNFKNDASNNKSISSNIVWDIDIDHNGKIWLATDAGVDQFDLQNKYFIHFPIFDNMKFGVSWISVDHENDLWLGANELKIFRRGVGIIKSLKIHGRGFYMDSQGRYWIMTNDQGIIQVDKDQGEIKTLNEKDGLSGNLTYNMLEDATGNLWISTARGLSCYVPDSNTFHNFYSYNGLAGNKFNYGAATKSTTGELLFGGKNGLTIVNPDHILENKYVPPVYITDIKIFNKSVHISNKKNAILKNSILVSKEIKVPYKFNVISFEFAALNYTNSNKNQYKYMLEGFDNSWNKTMDSRSVTYTNLNPGEYVFHVIGSNDNLVWNDEGAKIKLIILPPYYKKVWFKLLVVFVFITTTSLIFLFIFKRRELAKEYEFEKEKAKKLREIDSFKLKLFTNISHEIKTPLTLIISPLKKILKHNFSDPELRENIRLMEKNANQLMNLVTQLLDFNKIQNGNLSLDLRRGDIVRFTKNVFYSFEGLMKEKGLTYSFGSVQNRITTNFDADKLKKILNNLLSNAIRYNRPGGAVTLLISMIMDDFGPNHEDDRRYIKIEVKDTGIGIKKDAMPKIFKRFYNTQNPSIDDINSSGIGLNITKELVELHKGKIVVESTENVGSAFTVFLPYYEVTSEESTPVNEEKPNSVELVKTREFSETQKNKKILLVIEDNEDVAKFISNHFNKNFLVLEANNGDEGLELAFETIPDIIISDIMMPGMNGKEVCERVKKDERTSHIPVLLLTALDSKENIKEGLAVGADDYIIKPFDIEILDAKIENLFQLRKSLMRNYSKLNLLQPSKKTVKTLDEKFLEKAVRITEKHMEDPELNIDKFVELMSISRMQLYRKFAALTNMTVKEFVNDIRLKRAEQMFSDKKISVSEVAYSVGFNDLSYFGRCFKKKFGMSPSQYNIKQLESRNN